MNIRSRAGDSFADKAEFAYVLRNQFGFDGRTADIMWRIYKAIGDENTDYSQTDIDSHFCRLMASVDYSSTSFNETAGDVLGKMSFTEYIASLGITQEDAAHLEFTLWLQHYMTADWSKAEVWILAEHPNRINEILSGYNDAYGTEYNWPDNSEEFLAIYEPYYDAFLHQGFGTSKADFTHQMFTMSAGLINIADVKHSTSTADLGIGVMLHPQAFDDIHSHADIRVEASGWWGDVCGIKGFMGIGKTVPGMDNDDYMSDLDAVNILHIYNNGDGQQSLTNIMNEYYLHGDPDKERATLFRESTIDWESDVSRVTAAWSGKNDLAGLRETNEVAYYYLLSVHSGSGQYLNAELVAELGIDEQAFIDSYS